VNQQKNGIPVKKKFFYNDGKLVVNTGELVKLYIEKKIMVTVMVKRIYKSVSKKERRKRIVLLQ